MLLIQLAFELQGKHIPGFSPLVVDAAIVPA